MFNLRLSKILKDIQWSFISLATASLAHLLLRVLLSKDLGPYGLGIYTLVFTIYMFGMQFASFGIGAALIKYVAEHSGKEVEIKKYISSGTLGSFFIGSIMGILLYSFSGVISVNFFHNTDMIYLLKITSMCFPFIAIQKSVLGSLNGFQKMDYFAFLNVAQNISMFVLSVFLVKFVGLNVEGAVFGFTIPTVIIGLISPLMIRNFIDIKACNNCSFKELLYFGFYIVLGNSIALLYTQIDSIMIGYFTNETNVGYYAVASIMINGITLIPSAVASVTNPLITQDYSQKKYKKLQKLIVKTALGTVIISLVISLLFLFFGEILIINIFTNEFIPAYKPLLILLIGYCIYSPFISIGTTFSSIGKVSLSYKISSFSAILNIILNAIFIQKYGISGAAFATSITLIITTAANAYFIRKYIWLFNYDCVNSSKKFPILDP